MISIGKFQAHNRFGLSSCNPGNFLLRDRTTTGKSIESVMHTPWSSIRRSTIGLPRSTIDLCLLGECESMANWLDYDPISTAVLMFGLAAVVSLALSI